MTPSPPSLPRTPAVADSLPCPQRVRAVLEGLLASPHFRRSARLQRFLRFVVERTLAGKEDSLKETTIAMEVYRRGPEFDPRTDPIVRTEAHRLRRKLELYYRTEGASDPIVIELLPGSYVPRLLTRAEQGRRSDERRLDWPRVAILPFDDFSADGDQEPLCRALSDALITRLAGRDGLRVVSRSSAARFRAGSVSAHEIARSLGAQWLVEGAFERQDDRCRLSVQLVRGADEETVWAREYRPEWSRLEQTQDEIAAALALELGGGPERRASTRSSSDQFEALARARFAVAQYQNAATPEHRDDARRRLEALLATAPDDVDATVELARLQILTMYNAPGSGPGEEETRALLERALTLEPESPPALYLLSEIVSRLGEGRRAIDLARRAVTLDGDDSGARVFLALRYLERGFWEEALVEAERAIVLDHLSSEPYGIAVRSACLLARFARAEEEIERMARRIPGSHVVDQCRSHLALERGDLAAALGAMEEARARAVPGAEITHLPISEAVVRVLQGRTPRDRSQPSELIRPRARFWGHATSLCFAVGDLERAVAHLGVNPYVANYRWLIGNRLARRWLGREPLRGRLEELWQEWQGDLDSIATVLRSPPPALPEPAEVLREAGEDAGLGAPLGVS